MSDDKITYEDIIGRVKEKLNCSSDRISDVPTSFGRSWWPFQLDYQDELLSEYHIGTKFKALEKEVCEEIDAIRETLDELEYETEIADSQKRSADDGSQMMTAVYRLSTAKDIWDQIGVPIRRRGNIVFGIWTSTDVFISPIIKASPIDLFVNVLVEKTSSDRIEIERLKKTMDKWRSATIILAVIIALRLLTWFF